jgi:hypothetical protein
MLAFGGSLFFGLLASLLVVMVAGYLLGSVYGSTVSPLYS